MIPVPDKDSKLDWVCYSIDVDFYPEIKLDRAVGLKFCSEVQEVFEVGKSVFESDCWEISGSGAGDGILVIVTKSSLSIFVGEPKQNLEWYEQRIVAVIKAFANRFTPIAMLESTVGLTGLLDLPEMLVKVEGDDSNETVSLPAMGFLGGCVMSMTPKKFQVFERPIEMLGLKFTLPAGKDKKTNEVFDWEGVFKIDSATFDEDRLRISTNAVWKGHSEWSEELPEKLGLRLHEIENFISTKIIEFLRHSPVDDRNDD